MAEQKDAWTSFLDGALPFLVPGASNAASGGGKAIGAKGEDVPNGATDPGNPNVIPSAPLSGFLGETEIAGNKIGLHWTTRGLIGTGYVALGVGLAIVGLVFVVGGLNETKQLVKGVTRGIV